eukprot:gene5861-5930_t
MDDRELLEYAIAAARQGASEGGVPIGGALVVEGKVLGVGYNKRVQLGSAIRHGETDCLENIGRLPASIYAKATMYTTLSPCHMCSGAILLYGIPRVVLGENETFMGAEDLLRSHGVEVINLNSQECKDLMAKFIAEKPDTVHTVWSQWPELTVPQGFQKLSPLDFPLDNSDLSPITIYVQPYMTGAETLEPVRRMSNLQILQVPNAGYDAAIPYVRDGITLCNAQGVHNASTAELAVGLAIAMRRGIPHFVREQDQGLWSHERMGSLNDSSIAIIGAGSIGQTLVSYLKPYEVEITTFSRSGGNGSQLITQLDNLLPTFDIIFLILPLNADSKHLFNAQRLALMKDGALLINVARAQLSTSPIQNLSPKITRYGKLRIYLSRRTSVGTLPPLKNVENGLSNRNYSA